VLRHCGNAQALTVLTNVADWVKFRVDRLSHEQMQQALGQANGLANWQEYGGMIEVLANLYGVTGNPDHLRMACAFNHDVIFDPLARGKDQLNGLHANTQIPKMTGAAREYELTGETQFRDIARNFWNFVALDRSYCIGGHSDSEHFFPVSDFGKHLSPETGETCNTYNMLKLTRHLFAWEPSAPLMDFYERALYNHILAAQDPQQGMFIHRSEPPRRTSASSRIASGPGAEVSALWGGDGVEIRHASSELARVVLRSRPSALDGMEGQRMRAPRASSHRRSGPYRDLVESYHVRSTRWAIWTPAIHESQQPSPRSQSYLIRPPHSRRAELDSLRRSR